jgi:1-deoxy-D-xylulose-5-phosphate synthase
VALHDQPVVMVFDRAGITGDDGASHHGVLDLALSLAIPGVTVFAPSSAEEIGPMLETALSLEGPSTIRFPKTPARHVPSEDVGQGLRARKVRQGTGTVCLIGVGKMLEACLDAAELLQGEGVDATVWDPRVIAPADGAMLDDAARHLLVVTAEDGIRLGGAGTHLVDAIEQHARVLGHEVPTSITLGIPKTFLAHGKPDVILTALGLDGPGIAASVLAGLAGSALPSQPIEALEH